MLEWNWLVLVLKWKLRTSTGCPKKDCDPRLMSYSERGHQKWTKDKSSMSFAKFRLFPFQWTQKLPSFMKKQPRKTGRTWLPSHKKGIIQCQPVDSWSAHSFAIYPTLCRWEKRITNAVMSQFQNKWHNLIEYYIEIIDQYCMEFYGFCLTSFFLVILSQKLGVFVSIVKETRPGVDKVKPKGWLKCSLQIN